MSVTTIDRPGLCSADDGVAVTIALVEAIVPSGMSALFEERRRPGVKAKGRAIRYIGYQRNQHGRTHPDAVRAYVDNHTTPWALRTHDFGLVLGGAGGGFFTRESDGRGCCMPGWNAYRKPPRSGEIVIVFGFVDLDADPALCPPSLVLPDRAVWLVHPVTTHLPRKMALPVIALPPPADWRSAFWPDRVYSLDLFLAPLPKPKPPRKRRAAI
jgi:hypothetical protein